MSAVALEEIVLADDMIVQFLKTVKNHGPSSAYVAAGSVRNLVWDKRYGRVPDYRAADVDVVYFDTSDRSRESESRYEKALTTIAPGHDWQVRNQARMHVPAGDPPYKNMADALSHWPETATAVAARLDTQGGLELVTPFGPGDLMGHVLRPTPAIMARDVGIFRARVQQKRWLERWPDLEVLEA
ncbi:nucleotidyltransferase family protein [Kordiimonas aestuarii]|uniref:nucleotidyltransferase family protein n=1 Tax=Kordiimonas aestuarii TaxID=1005925 RepID=UPI0021D15E6A|nr:nucleotidyltransferase family protein [Kordiimonas aestuarii]